MKKPKHPKILIVEDDDISSQLMKILLEPLEGEILLAKTGPAAIEICRNHKDIDVILMDIRMPGMSGYEAVRKIREFNQTVYIIAQSAYTLKEDGTKSIEAGCNNFISKPIDGEDLLQMVRAAMQNRTSTP